MSPEAKLPPVADGAPLAIVCGSGAFPLAVAAAAAKDRPVFLIGLEGAADGAISRYPHGWTRLGQFGRLTELAQINGCRDVLFVGGVTRPSGWRDLKPDLAMLRLVPRFLRAFRGGDDKLLTSVAAALAESGLNVVGVPDVAPSLMAPAGRLGSREASHGAVEDARFGLDVLDALAPYDVGQSIVVANRRVLAIEAAEGTDRMIARIAELRASGRLRLRKGEGVLVKGAKRGQDLRLDTPAIGPQTIAGAAAAGLGGVAVVAREVMALEPQLLAERADHEGLFLLGIERAR